MQSVKWPHINKRAPEPFIDIRLNDFVYENLDYCMKAEHAKILHLKPQIIALVQ